jgi:hypothetical protein
VKKLLPLLAAGAVLGLVLAALAAAGSRGEVYKVSSTLAAKGEVPAPKAMSGAGGKFSGSYAENAKGAVLTWKLTFSHLTGAATAAHIHKGKPGVAGAVLVPLCGPCKSAQSGKITISKSVISAIEAGGTYVNVHTTKNAGGEIRGQVKATG